MALGIAIYTYLRMRWIRSISSSNRSLHAFNSALVSLSIFAQQTMADLSKWADHALILSKHADELLIALYCVKKTLDNEIQLSTDILCRGGSIDVTVNYRGTNLIPESPSRPSMTRMALFIDPSISSIQKQVLKKFPDVGNLGKVKIRSN
jgi:hypothetical protein